MILLTDEEIPGIEFKCHYITGFEKDSAVRLRKWGDDIAKAQLKKVVEWLYMPCTEHPVSEAISPMRKNCPKCWQALLEETK